MHFVRLSLSKPELLNLSFITLRQAQGDNSLNFSTSQLLNSKPFSTHQQTHRQPKLFIQLIKPPVIQSYFAAMFTTDFWIHF